MAQKGILSCLIYFQILSLWLLYQHEELLHNNVSNRALNYALETNFYRSWNQLQYNVAALSAFRGTTSKISSAKYMQDHFNHRRALHLILWKSETLLFYFRSASYNHQPCCISLYWIIRLAASLIWILTTMSIQIFSNYSCFNCYMIIRISLSSVYHIIYRRWKNNSCE
jgi:hypothetical protein